MAGDVSGGDESKDVELVSQRWRPRPESWWWIAAVVLIPVTVLTALAALVLSVTTHPANAGDQISLVRTALSVGAGTGGMVALILAGRRQWSAEQAERGLEKARQASERDATERRITELYSKAVDQLGSDKAPVRLGGLYALERLAQDNPRQRQTIVNVLCAYLRMPYELPSEPAKPKARAKAAERLEYASQERQVRLAAQRILVDHLHPGPRLDDPVATYWPDTDLDLTGAVLINANFTDCHLRAACFSEAVFVDFAAFRATYFTGEIRFDEATFTDNAMFDRATFIDSARFDRANFTSVTSFRAATFADEVSFEQATFTHEASFHRASFTDHASFHAATFTNRAGFDGATFSGNTMFEEAVFTSIVSLKETAFASGVSFRTAGFDRPDITVRCWVRLDVALEFEREWPTDWREQPCDDRPPGVIEGSWGRVCRVSELGGLPAVSTSNSTVAGQSSKPTPV